MQVKTKEDVAAVNEIIRSYVRKHGLGLINARAVYDPRYAAVLP